MNEHKHTNECLAYAAKTVFVPDDAILDRVLAILAIIVSVIACIIYNT